jgi:hypothetical protein
MRDCSKRPKATIQSTKHREPLLYRAGGKEGDGGGQKKEPKRLQDEKRDE